MRKISKYLLTAAATVAFSLSLASAAAQACTIEVQDEYTCYVIGEDENYCYYRCYCKTNSRDCEAALERDGFEPVN